MKFKKLDNDIFVSEIDRSLIQILEPYYHIIAVNMECDEIQSSLDWPFLPTDVIFGEPIDPTKSAGIRKKTMMLLDKLAGEEHAVLVGGLNYYQFSNNVALTPCVYKKINGEWHYSLHPSVMREISEQYGI